MHKSALKISGTFCVTVKTMRMEMQLNTF